MNDAALKFDAVTLVAQTQGSPVEILRRAVDDTHALIGGGCDALVVENFGDVPFFAERVPPETVATMALALEVPAKPFV